MSLTKEQFQLLDPPTQERFVNSGGILCEQKDSEVCSSPSLSIAHQQADKIETTSSVAASTSDIDKSQDSFALSLPVATSRPDGFDIKDPIELLFLIDEDIASGQTKLHPWQIQFMLDFADERNTKDFAFKGEARACNGSGKDKYLVASCVVWLCMRYRQSRAVVTNGSGVQLDNQTETYINQLANKINRKFNQAIWRCNYRYYECLPTESPVTLFATDEPNKAEGYHPLIPGGKMAIVASEAKGIPVEIFTALSRCTGFTHRIDVSTPGLPMGTFFERCSSSVNRKTIKDIKLDISPEDNIEYHITAADCPHITEYELKTMEKDFPGGKEGAAYKSAVFAEFGTTDEMVVIPYSFVIKAIRKSIDSWIQEPFNKAGLDLSDGGDECVLFIRNGNRHLKTIPFRFEQPDDTIEYLETLFRENGLTNPKAYIFGDYGGIGSIILKRLKRKGWTNIRFCDNRAKTTRPKVFKNWGAESWFNFATLLKRTEIILLGDDSKLTKQLSTRYYKIIDGAVHQLLSKLEMRGRGYPSPDRADAAVLAFSDYQSTFNYEEEEKDKPFEKEVYESSEPKMVGDFSLKSFAKGFSSDVSSINKRWNVNNGQKTFSELEGEIADYNKQRQLVKL